MNLFEEWPRLDAVRLDATVLGFTLVVSIVTGLLFGLAPLLQVRRGDVMTALREEGRTAGGREGVGRMRPVLVSLEVALALVLLVAAGLLIRSFAALSHVNPGFDPANTLTFRIGVPPARYETPESVRQFHTQLEQQLSALPGVRAAGGTSTLFLSRLPNMSSISVEGRAAPPEGAPVESVVYGSATTGFFNAMGIRLVNGRALSDSDREDTTPVAVVNEAFVRRYFSGENPIGRRFTFGNPAEDTDWIEIIGVIADVRRSGLAETVRPEAWFPYAQGPSRVLTYALRTNGDPMALLSGVRSTVRALDPLLPISAIRTLEESLSESLAARRFIMLLLAALAGLAATLAAIGIYGVVSYLVAQRTRELGVRMALGARRMDVLRLVLAQSLRQVMPGVLAGALAALVLTRLLQSQLFGVQPHDPLTFAAVAVALVAISVLATLLPARRASAVDPIIALRRE